MLGIAALRLEELQTGRVYVFRPRAVQARTQSPRRRPSRARRPSSRMQVTAAQQNESLCHAIMSGHDVQISAVLCWNRTFAWSDLQFHNRLASVCCCSTCIL